MSTLIQPRIDFALSCLRGGKLEEAEKELRALLETSPRLIPANLLLAGVLVRAQRISEAEVHLAVVLEQEPNSLDALGLMAVAKRSTGDFAAAAGCFERVASLGMRNADIFNQIGSCYLALEDAVKAGDAFKKAIEVDRNSALNYFNLGLALKLGGRSFETFATFKRSAELDPTFFETYVEMWQQVRQLLNWEEAEPLFNRGLELFSDSAQLLVIVASIRGKLGRSEEAEVLFQKAVALDTAAAPAFAYWLQEEGRFDASVPILLDSILKQPIQGQAYYNLAIAKHFEVDNEPISDRVLRLLESDEIGEEGQMFLNYAMAKYSENEKEYGDAMGYYDRANELAYALYNQKIERDEPAIEEEFAVLEKLFSRERISALRKFGSNSETPICIVGMIRTGTTLLDQVLSSHKDISSAGEQPFWQLSAGRVNRKWMEGGNQKQDIEELAHDYIQVLEKYRKGRKRVTDKMPTNFVHLGLMNIAFPKAKFIHIRRNPLDTCLSIYTTFLGSGTQFAYNQENIVSYYKNYLRVMDFWRTVLPPKSLIEIDYESLVSSKEVVLPKLFTDLGLPWDSSVLQHEKNTSRVSTPSLWTARQPINRGSVERWRKYEPWLGQLLELQSCAHPPLEQL